jgi:hypothetical protein
MEVLFKKISGLFQSFLSLLKILIRSKYKVTFPESSSPKCLILGNGPSVKQDLEFLLDSDFEGDLLCLNKFPDTAYYQKLKPRHFVIVSEEYWNKGSIEEYQLIRDNIIKAFIEKTTWPVNFLVPAGARKHKAFMDQFRQNELITPVFYNTTPVEGNQTISHLFFNRKWGSPRPHNVLIPSILNMIWMDYKEIAVIGADHSWLETLSVNENNEALLNQKHFYDENQTRSRKVTRKGSSYRKLHEILEKFMLTFKAYFMLNDYAESKGIKLYNCSSKSYIDSLERKPLKDFLEK